MATTLISRDPFARTELHRKSVSAMPGRMLCDWCGNRNARGNLFRYSVQHDAGAEHMIPGYFCSVGCMRSFNS